MDTGESNPNLLLAGALSPVSYMPHHYHPRSRPRPCNGSDHRLYKKRRLPLHHRLNGGPDRSCTYDAPLGVRFYRPMRPTDIRLVPKKWWPVWVTLPLAPLGEQVYSLLRLFNDLPSHENTGAVGEDRTRI